MQRGSSLSGDIVVTDIPARLDRLPWGRFHTLVVLALGITWILDGLEVTLAGAVAGALRQSPVLQFTSADIGLAGSAYIAGAVVGAMFFGWLTDRLGRKKLFFITLSVYLVATAATAFTWNIWSFMLCRFVTGAGIGGEYVAINSTIQELVPARVRGWTDLAINGSFWVGAAIGAAGSIVLLDPNLLPVDLGWRAAFLIGAALAVVIFFLRLWIPESPRWLMTHNRDHCLDRDVFLRLGRSEFRLPDRKRDVSAGDPRARHRFLLCARYRRRRHSWPAAVRGSHRDGITLERIHGLSAGRRPHDRRSAGRGGVGCRGRAQAAGDGEPTAGVSGLSASRGDNEFVGYGSRAAVSAGLKQSRCPPQTDRQSRFVPRSTAPPPIASGTAPSTSGGAGSLCGVSLGVGRDSSTSVTDRSTHGPRAMARWPQLRTRCRRPIDEEGQDRRWALTSGETASPPNPD